MTLDAEQIECLRDGFGQDMAESQKRNGKIPTPQENLELAIPIFERVERELEAEKYRPQRPTTGVQKKGAADALAAKQGAKILRDDQLPSERIAVLKPVDLEIFMRMRERVALLMARPESGVLGLPSWRDRVLAALATYRHHKAKGTTRDANPGWGELLDVLDRSDEVFGRWSKKPERRIYG